MRNLRKVSTIAVFALLLQSVISGQRGQSAPMPGRDWLYHGGDPGGLRFSTMIQLMPDNVKLLTSAWTFHTGATRCTFETTPLVIYSVLYFNAANGVYALEAVTRTQLWKYEATGVSTRGPEYWPGGSGVPPRLFTTTSAGLVALDLKTGVPVSAFGEKGVVKGAGQSTTTTSIFKNFVIPQDKGHTVQDE